MARTKLKKKKPATRPLDSNITSEFGQRLNALPPELLARIFEIGAEPDNEKNDEDAWEDEADDDTSSSSSDKSFDADDENPLPFELLVASVCRQWREVALATPTLWTSLWTSLSPFDLAHGAIHLDVVTNLLQRTKGAPLDLALDIAEVRLSDDPDIDPDTLEPEVALRLCLACFKTVMDHAWHWHDIEIAFDGEGIDHMARFLELLYKVPAAPMLVALSVHVEDPDLPDEDAIPICAPAPTAPLFGGVRPPRLSRTTIWGAPLGFDTRICSVLLTGLRVLELGLLFGAAAPKPVELLEILRANPLLEQLELHHCSPPPDAEWPAALPDDEIALPRLHELRLAGLPAVTLHALVRRISSPGLRTLELGLDEEEAEFDSDGAHVRAFLDTVAVRTPGLQHLRLDGFAHDSTVLVPFFRALRALDDLTLEVTPVNVSMLSLLRYEPPAPAPNTDEEVLNTVPLPKLHTLRLLSPETDLEVPDLLEVLRTRSAALVPIRHLFLHDALAAPEDDVLRQYVETVEYFDPEEYEDDGDDVEVDGWTDEDEDDAVDNLEFIIDDLDEDEDEDEDDNDELDLLSSQFQLLSS